MRVCRALLVVCLLGSLTFAAVPDRVTRAIDSSQTVPLARSVHPKAQAHYDEGAVAPDFPLGYVTLVTSPSPSQQQAIDRLLAEQQDPASPNYHQWLTPEQYADRFGLSHNDLNKITAWLKAQGFTVLSVPRGHNSIIVSGMAYQFESAFQTQIHHYNVDGRLHYGNSTPLRIPAALSGIVASARGLNDFRMKPMNFGRRVHPEYYDSSYQTNFLSPGDIKMIYDLAPLYTNGIDGTGQKLAVVGQTDIYIADINDFRSGFGLPQISGCTTNSNNVVTACNSTNFRYVLVGTETGIPSACGDLGEADLDIEWSGATARNAQIIFVNSPLVWNSTCKAVTNSNGGVESALSYAIQNVVAPVISMSYGNCEAQANNDETELQQANLQGITVLNSSGDTSVAGCDGFTNTTTPPNLATGGLAVGYPASSPEVTGVGGTAVPFANTKGSPYWATSNSGTDLGSALQYVPEQSWNDPAEFAAFCQANSGNSFCTTYGITSPLTAQEALGLGGGGAGASNCYNETASGVCQAGFPQPAWQTVTISGQDTRMVPDVSLIASPNFVGYILCTPLSEIGLTGSTSSCAPGGAAGIANALALKDSKGNPNPSVLGGTSASAPVFAGMITLLNQYLGNASGMGNANPMLYQLAAVAPSAFHDVTAGNSVVYCQPGTPSIQPTALQCPASGSFGYQAGVGYDLVTGLGSVDANNLAIAWKTPPDFSAASGGGITVYGGQSGSATITVTPVNGFSQAVAFSCSGLPSGASCSFNANPITVPATTTTQVTVQTAGSNPAGTSSFSVVATTGVLSQAIRTASQSLTIQEPDFSLAVNGGSSPTVSAGQTATYSLTATPTTPGTFTTAVTFTCSFSPADATLANSCSATSVPAGNGQTQVTLSIKTAGPNTGTVPANQRRADSRSPWLPFAFPLAGIVVTSFVGRRIAKHSLAAGLCVCLVMLGLLVGCGGGGGSTPPPPISVTMTPSSAVSLYANEAGNTWAAGLTQQKFSATVNNSTNQAVSWQVNGVAGGNSTFGTVDSTGNYSAPASVPNPASFNITAVAQADSTKSGSTRMNILTPTALGTYTVTVTATEALRTHTQTVHLTVK